MQIVRLWFLNFINLYLLLLNDRLRLHDFFSEAWLCLRLFLDGFGSLHLFFLNWLVLFVGMLPICAFTSKIYLIPINKGVSIIPIIFIDSKCPWVRVFLFLLSISVYLPVIVVVISSVVESNLFSKPVSHIIIKIAPVHSFTAAIICIMAASTNWTWFLLLRALIALFTLFCNLIIWSRNH